MEGGEEDRPRISAVLETVLYFTDALRTETFYRKILGMRLIGKDDDGRNLFFRAGSSVFLLFNATATQSSKSVPAHGALGPGHSCFLAPGEDYRRWKDHLERAGVPVIQETRWSRGNSFYFRDPDGNVLEIADSDIWPE